jgi:hypothetical protein
MSDIAEGFFDLAFELAKMILILLVTFSALSISSVRAEVQGQPSYQVGALGDDTSRSNLGVAVQIQTHSYDSYPGAFDYFWVGNNLADGSFVQFGYSIEPGTYCLRGASIAGKYTCFGPSEQILDSDARWQWQYWPNREGHDFYYQIGPAGSAGANGTWHEYKIVSSSNNSWIFEFDHVPLSTLNVHAQISSDPAYIAAEKSAISSSLIENLGPVEFANLSYLTPSGWRPVDSLVSFANCGQSPPCAENPYGIESLRQNLIIAGSGLSRPTSGSLLWTSGYSTLAVHVPQNVKFDISFLSEQRSYQGAALVSIPKGMYAYVTISTPSVQTAGPLGELGARDQFEDWTGDINSGNLTIRVLMNVNRQISSVWVIQLLEPALIVAALGGVVVIALVSGFRRRESSQYKVEAMVLGPS